jgi:metallo-beta-lactamase family protein
LYTTLDVLDTLRLFSSFAHYKKPVRLNGRVKATFRDAGHIFGSAFIEIDIQGWGRMVFSGDLGNRDKPVIRDPSYTAAADLAVVEGTYGNRHHKSIDDSIEELRNAIDDTCKRGGNVLIPSFAIERAQELLYILREFHEQKELPAFNVFLDSPMAIKMTDVMRRNPEFYDNETEKLVQRLGDPFDFPGLQLTRTSDESRKINFIRSNAIIIAGSGMCTGGRIKHHLKQNIWRKESSIIFVGYQAKGTLGRMLVDRKKRVKIFGDSFRVKSPIYTIGGFSSHADQGIIIDWLQHMKNLKQIFLVHGEESGLIPLRDELMKQKVGKKIHVPHIHERFSIK